MMEKKGTQKYVRIFHYNELNIAKHDILSTLFKCKVKGEN